MPEMGMEQQYAEALNLFQQGKHLEALALFDQLGVRAPDNKDVLYGSAMCLAAMGRAEETREICERLKAIFGDPRAEQLLASLAATQFGAAGTAAPRARGGLWRTLAAVAVVLLLSVVTIVAPVVLSQDGDTKALLPAVEVERHPTNLRTLDLERNPIGNDSMRDLQGLDGLEELDLNFTNISDEGLMHLRSIATLRRLPLKGTQVTNQGVSQLMGAIPSLEVIRD